MSVQSFKQLSAALQVQPSSKLVLLVLAFFFLALLHLVFSQSTHLSVIVPAFQRHGLLPPQPSHVEQVQNAGLKNLTHNVDHLIVRDNQTLTPLEQVKSPLLQDKEQNDTKPAGNSTELKEDAKQATHPPPSTQVLDVKAPENKELKEKAEDEVAVISKPGKNETTELNDAVQEPIAAPQPSYDSTVKERLDWLKDNWDKIKILNTDDPDGKEFSTRMDNFLGAGACNLWFFMVWIAPLSAFGSREKLAVESVFKSHPLACLVLLSRTLDSPKGRLILNPLSERGLKILAISPHIPSLVKSTPAEKWFKDLKQGLIDPGTISINQNLSNLLRLAALYKYGGIYIDTDVIVMKSFANFSNVIGVQDIDQKTGKWSVLNNAVLVFEKGNPLLLSIMEEFYLTFDGSKWGQNGPHLVSRVVMKEGERGCTILSPSAFYPVDWNQIGSFFHAPKNSTDKQWVEAKLVQLNQHSFAIHLWNKMSRGMEVEPGSVMDSIFRRFCILCDMQHTDRNVVLNNVNSQ